MSGAWSRLVRLVRLPWTRLGPGDGSFAAAEESERAERLSAQWFDAWGDTEPRADQLRSRYPERWVRYHTDAPGHDKADMLLRYRALQEHLAGTDGVVVLAQDWASPDTAAGWTTRLLPGAWPWRGSGGTTCVLGSNEETRSFYWVGCLSGWGEIRRIVQAATRDEATFILTNRSLTWLYAPYYAGVDIFAVEDGVVEALRATFPEWQSQRADGL